MVNAPSVSTKDIDFNWSYLQSFTQQPYSHNDLDAPCYKNQAAGEGGGS